MKEKEIILKWKKDEKVFQKRVRRKKLMAIFEGLIKGFSPNNTVSKQLSEIIPVADEIKINWDSTQEINQLYYKENDKVGSIPIIHTHSVVWSVLAKLCEITEECEEREEGEEIEEIPLSDF